MMKRNTKNFVRLVICCLFMIILSGCDFPEKSDPFTYSFRQSQENIVKVEICEYKGRPEGLNPLVKLTDLESDSILAEIQAVECYKIFLGDGEPRDYGGIAVAITYLDGEIEIIGLRNVGYITANGRGMMERYQFQMEGIRAVIGKYVDLDAYFAQKEA